MGFVQQTQENIGDIQARGSFDYTQTTTSIAVVDPEEFGLEADKAKEVESAFTPVIVERDFLAKQYADVINKPISQELTTEARELRLKLVKVRTNTDRIHKATKAFYLAGGRFVDAWRNKNVTVIEQMEEKLDSIENHYVMIENQRLDQLESDRRDQLAEVADNISMYPLRDMDEDAFNNLYEGLKMIKEKQIELQKQAEAERIAAEAKEAEERIRIQKENERLKMEAIERERKVAADKAEAERLAKIEREKQEKVLAAERAKIAKEREEQEAKLAAERKAKAEAEAKLADIAKQKEAERKAQAAAQRKAQRAPDKVKLQALVAQIESLSYPQCADDDIQDIVDYAKQGIAEIVEYLNTSLNAID